MGQSPFAKPPTGANPQANRRSTRVNYTVPIVISGRDASNQSYREETETLIVSFHGAKLKTRNQILTGMHLTVENLQEGVAEEAICVGVTEAEAGHEQHAIAIQLLHPRNVWGVKEPPADWKSASEGQPLTPSPGTHPAAPATPQPPVSPTVVTQAAALDQRSAELAESVLQIVRRQAAEILRTALKDFEDRLKVLESGAEAKFSEYSERAITDSQSRISAKVSDAELLLAKMRRELMEQIADRTAEAITSAEEILRLKLAGSLSTMVESSGTTMDKQIGPDESK